MAVPTLYEWAGGMESFEKLFEAFYDKVLKDDILSPVFSHISPEHTKHVAHFVAEVFGGPKVYTEQDSGSHAHMVSKHLHKMIDHTKRKRWVELLLETADKMGIPDDPEFRSSMVAYLEWGSRLAVINSNIKDITLDQTTPMPKWGWGETGGPYQPKS